MPELSPFWQMETMRRTMRRKQEMRAMAERSAFKKRRKESRREGFAQKRDIGGTITYLKAKARQSKWTIAAGPAQAHAQRGYGVEQRILAPGQKKTGTPIWYTPLSGLKSGSIKRSGKRWTTSGYTTKEGERDSFQAATRTTRKRDISGLGNTFGVGRYGRARRNMRNPRASQRKIQGTSDGGRIRETYSGF